jgi:hypothetical protein
MTTAWLSARLDRVWRSSDAVLAVLFVTAVGTVMTLRDFGVQDDLLLITTSIKRSFAEVFVSSHQFDGSPSYRPVVDATTKLFVGYFGLAHPYYALYQTLLAGMFAAGTLWLCAIFKLDRLATIAVAALVLASPSVWQAFTWWSNIGSAYIAVAAVGGLAAVQTIVTAKAADANRNRVPVALAFCLALIASAAKENGLAIAVGLAVFLAVAGRHAAAVAIAAAGAVYIIARMFVLPIYVVANPFIGSSGFLLDWYDADELAVKFGAHPYPFYLWNIVAQTSYVLIGEPVEGQINFANLNELGFVVAIASILLRLSILAMLANAWRAIPRPLLAGATMMILANAVISFPYARARTMIVGDIAFAVLGGLAITHLVSAKAAALGLARQFRRLAGAAALLACALAAIAITSGVRQTLRMAANDEATVIQSSQPPYEGVAPDIYAEFRDRILARHRLRDRQP